ncbi:hypothetical protein [Silvibacterium dinghuense]|uniref:Uncharacterized protein n=1 Tax=Silvibacterium dinghuense TaxID=1560006 RepID=A0A4Q1SIE9_9BACT|nr:hypothetical protein [Silvibacterium dinghuense]RXS97376.1 hypothetical protein ESZ00_05585 [Silvibacterium dinghuense]GGG98488.1 hypothetical protein GCM10011586_12370 [Silvibacterium dinghuense]
MFVRKLRVEWAGTSGERHACPVAWLDSFALRNLTGHTVFDDILPIGHGLLEAGLRVPLDVLRAEMEDCFRGKGYLGAEDRLVIEEKDSPAADSGDRTAS